MKKAKNEPLKVHVKSKEDFDRDNKMRKAMATPKQKKPLSIYDDFDEDEEIEELIPEDDDDDPDSIWDYYDDDEDEEK